MEQITLLVILVVSTVCCVVNLIFYTRLWWRDRGWVTTIMALIPPPFLMTRLLEIQKLCAEWMGQSYTSPVHARVWTGLLGLVLCGVQTTALAVKFWPLLKDVDGASVASGERRRRVMEDKQEE